MALKDLGTFLKHPQINIKLTGFEDNDGSCRTDFYFVYINVH